MLRNVHDAHSPHALCRGAGHSSVCISCLVHALVAEPLLGLAEAVVHDACVASGDPQLAWQLASAVGDSDRSSPLLATYIASALASRSNDRSFCDKVLNLASCLCQASHTFWSALGGSLAQNIGTAPAQSALFNALADTATHFPAAQMPLDQFAAYVVDAANSALRGPLRATSPPLLALSRQSWAIDSRTTTCVMPLLPHRPSWQLLRPLPSCGGQRISMHVSPATVRDATPPGKARC